jgi:hypothetical protein
MRPIQDGGSEFDEVLIADVEEQLRYEGLDEDEVEFRIECMLDAGCFRVW